MEKRTTTKSSTTSEMKKMAYHTYTTYSEKSHAFLLRGLVEGTKIQDIKDNEIVAR